LTPIRKTALTYAVFFVALGSSWAFLPVYYRGLGLGLETIGLLSAFSAGIQLVAAPVWGLLDDRYPRSRRGLPAAALVGTVGAGLLALWGGSSALPIAVAIMAVGLAGVGPVLDARTLELLGDRASRYGEVRAVGSMVFVAVTLVVGPLMDRAGTIVLFAVYVPALLGTALVSLTLPRGGTRRGQAAPGGARGGVRDVVLAPRMVAFLGGTLLVWAVMNAVNAFYSIQIVALGGSSQLVGITWAIGAAVEVPVMWNSRRLTTRFGSGTVLLLGAVAYACRAALAATAPDAGRLVALAPFEGLGFGLLFPASVGFVASRAPQGLAATAQGVLSATLGLSAILGSAIGGLVAGATSIGVLFAVSAVGGVVGAGLLWLSARTRAEDEAAIREAEASLADAPVIVPEELHP
jgi:MFS transporter, PPP family, 3-phenylpropionic acid transporter